MTKASVGERKATNADSAMNPVGSRSSQKPRFTGTGFLHGRRSMAFAVKI